MAPMRRAAPTSRIALQMSASDSFVPDMERRTLMNYLLLGSAGGVIAGLGGPFVLFFVPNVGGGGGGGVIAADANGTPVSTKGWLETHGPGDYQLVQGLKGDATYLVVTPEKKIADFGINAVCTHLGCVVPWNKAENKFMCPCHGSQYNAQGKVIRGPAPLSLALAHVGEDEGGMVSLTTWTETDFRTDLAPWWK